MSFQRVGKTVWKLIITNRTNKAIIIYKHNFPTTNDRIHTRIIFEDNAEFIERHLRQDINKKRFSKIDCVSMRMGCDMSINVKKSSPQIFSIGLGMRAICVFWGHLTRIRVF